MKYNALAPVYDKVMRHVNYDDWVKLIKKINSTYFLDTIPRIFEIGGGTGTLGKKLRKSTLAKVLNRIFIVKRVISDMDGASKPRIDF